MSKNWSRQHYLDWGAKYVREHDTFPRPADFPATPAIMRGFFGSWKEYKIELFELTNDDDKIDFSTYASFYPFRRTNKPRYCRQCGKNLPNYRWFFCPDFIQVKAREAGERISCMKLYRDKEGLEDNELERIRDEFTENVQLLNKTKMWKKCWNCAEDCKIYIEPSQIKPTGDVLCRADGEAFGRKAKELGGET